MTANHEAQAGRTFTPPTQETLAHCDEEPIHLPGAVQPHGCLFEVLGDELSVRCVSSNLREQLGRGAREVLGQPLAAVLGAGIATWARDQLAVLPPAAHASRVANLDDGRTGTAVVHHYLERRFVEWLADAEHRFPVPERMDEVLDQTVAQLDAIPAIDPMLQRMTEGVRQATGYDRVMVYRFHPDWHGEIAAESTEPGLSPYRGLHYPASDIPTQARRLYVETRVRVIGDVYARDAVLMDAQGDDVAGMLDLSHAFLRSVSPVHIQYLRNMGSGATLVTSLLVKGKLWGLIACHHRSRYAVPYYAFDRLRRFTDAAAAAIDRRLHLLQGERRAWLARGRERLAQHMATSPADALAELAALTGCEGLVAYAGGRVLTSGTVSAGALDLPALVLAQNEDVGVSDALRERFASARADAGSAGIAWVVLSRPYQAVIVFVRPEFQRTVSWGGDPEKAVTRDPVTKRLSPRGSFDLWRETVSGRSRPWEPEVAELLEFLREGADVKRWVDHVGHVAAG